MVQGDQEITDECYQSNLETRRGEMTTTVILQPDIHEMDATCLDPIMEGIMKDSILQKT